MMEVPFTKSSFSGGSDSCVEVGVSQGVIRVRDSKDRSGPELAFTPREWEAFLLGVKSGEFEFPR